jgi:excisionase family DNA binding protein
MPSRVPHITTGPEQVGVADAARITGWSPDTIRRAADSGKLPHKRTPGGQRRFLRSDVEALVKDES